MTDCKYGTDTGKQWGKCRTCTIVKCTHPERVARLNESILHSLSDLHTLLPEDQEKGKVTFVLTRSGYCNAEKCEDYTK